MLKLAYQLGVYKALIEKCSSEQEFAEVNQATPGAEAFVAAIMRAEMPDSENQESDKDSQEEYTSKNDWKGDVGNTPTSWGSPIEMTGPKT